MSSAKRQKLAHGTVRRTEDPSSSHQQHDSSKSVDSRVRQYFNEEARLESHPLLQGLSYPEIPTILEILNTEIEDPYPVDGSEEWKKLREGIQGFQHQKKYHITHNDANLIKEAWKTTAAYLETQYRLLRAEVVLPLAGCLKTFLQTPTMKEPPKGFDIGIYDQVRVVGFTPSSNGLGFRLQFGLGRVGKKILWEHSNRLKSGSLVVLVPTHPSRQADLKFFKVAIIAARPLGLVTKNPPEIDIFFRSPEDIELNAAHEYFMIEARTSFFEAHRHVLRGLQKISTEKFPLQEYIVKLQNYVAYKPQLFENQHIDLTSIFGTQDPAMKSVNIIANWPETANTSLDQSQVTALRSAISKSLSLIQGPPGCGKTFVSLQAMRILISNMKPGDPPIIVACQTNHALDQFLRHMAEFEPRFCRLGSRSKDEGVVKARTMVQLRYEFKPQKKQLPIDSSIRACYQELQTSRKLLEKIAEPFIRPQDKTRLLDVDDLGKRGILTFEQIMSLQRAASKWTWPENTDTTDKNPFIPWLGKDLVPAATRTAPHTHDFCLEEADHPVEEVRDATSQDLALEEDVDREILPGHHVEIGAAWTGKRNPAVTDATIREQLNKPNLGLIAPYYRGAVYQYLMDTYHDMISKEFIEQARKYSVFVQKKRIAHMERDEYICRQQKVVGLTTTRLSLDRALISSLKSRVILIEEAGEIIEAPIAISCVPSLQQLILVGDHQQLRPRNNSRQLIEKPYNFAVSMFERLIEGGVQYEFLNRQRRMKPALSRLLQPIYGDRLLDHPDVLTRPKVPGMGEITTFFMHHTQPDDIDYNFSACNEHEVNMIASFFYYLLTNGVSSATITILTFYNGQRKRLIDKIKADRRYNPQLHLNVSTVDSYQGEENNIVILSLVRSNKEGRLGFLEIANRVCVSISRARNGLYMFGNSKLLSRNSETWEKIIQILRRGSQEGEAYPSLHGTELPLTCQRHGRRTAVTEMSHWNEDGGCGGPCEGHLSCGHACPLRCHPSSHDKVDCTKECNLVLHCGHPCIKRCFQPCICKDGHEDVEDGFDARALARRRQNLDASASPRRPHVVGQARGHASSAAAWRRFAAQGPEEEEKQGGGKSPKKIKPAELPERRGHNLDLLGLDFTNLSLNTAMPSAASDDAAADHKVSGVEAEDLLDFSDDE